MGSAKNIGNTCFGNEVGLCLNAPISLGNIESVSYSECMSSPYGDDILRNMEYTGDEANKDKNYYMRAVIMCGGVDNIISYDDAKALGDWLIKDTSVDDGTRNARLASMGFPEVFKEENRINVHFYIPTSKYVRRNNSIQKHLTTVSFCDMSPEMNNCGGNPGRNGVFHHDTTFLFCYNN